MADAREAAARRAVLWRKLQLLQVQLLQLLLADPGAARWWVAGSTLRQAWWHPAAEAPIAWYLRTIADHELLTADEEIELSLLVQRMLAIRGKGEELAEDLGRPATQDELAAALSLGPAELKLHVQRGAAAG